jgi:O-methyltransferase involved in polyketide biosynthesis
MESSRDAGARLFSDPFAERLAGPDVMARLRARLSNDAASSSSAFDARRARGDDGRIAIRTKFFDDAVLEGLERASASASASATALGGASSSTPRILQVVLLGAGYDTRAWRLRPPEGVARDRVVVYEVDVADVLRRKREILGEATARAPTLGRAVRDVAADLENEDAFDALRRVGFDPSGPATWVLEGLLYYLSPETAKRTLRRCASESGPGSSLVASVVNPAALRRAVGEPERPGPERRGGGFFFGPLGRVGRFVGARLRAATRFFVSRTAPRRGFGGVSGGASGGAARGSRGGDSSLASAASTGERAKKKTAKAFWKSACDATASSYFAPWAVRTAAQPGDAKHAHFGRWTGAAPDAFAPETDEACRVDETPRTWYVKCVKAEGGSKDDENENQPGGTRRSGPR